MLILLWSVPWQVIGRNMHDRGDIKPIVPGSRVTAIFGFCDIRQFTDTTEVLQQEIMEFVNTIARIVHMEVGSMILSEGVCQLV